MSSDEEELGPEIWKSIREKLKPDPETGKLDNNDILTFLREYEDDPDVKKFLQHGEKRRQKRKQATNLETYDYASLVHTIQPFSIWRIRLEYTGLVDPATNYIIEPHELKEFPDAQFQHNFQIFADYPSPDEPGETETRLMENYFGLPKSEDVLLFIKNLFVLPIGNLKPGLPSILIITHKFEPHEAVLKPFLDSIPPPFSWYIESASTAEWMDDLRYSKASFYFKEHVKNGEAAKERGNAAFRRGDRKAAIEAYTVSLRRFEDAHCQKVMEHQKKAVMHLMAISVANRSAAALLPGEGMDITMAINDGKKALRADPSYAKGYARLARAYQMQGDLNEAQEALAQGLRRPDLENEMGLVDMLINLQSDGKLPTDNDELKSWARRMLEDDRMKHVGGAWRKRVTAMQDEQ